MVEWNHQLNAHEFEQSLGISDGQGSLACCSLWGCKESDTTEQLNYNKKNSDEIIVAYVKFFCVCDLGELIIKVHSYQLK